MGLWDKIAGTGSKQSTTQQSTTKASGTQAQTGSVSGGSSVTTLDEGTIGLLQGLIQQQGSGLGTNFSDEISGLSGQLAGLFDPASIEQSIQADQASAVQQYNNTVLPDLNVAANVIGSQGNSFSMLTKAQGGAQLATQLAQIAAQTRLQGQSLQAGALTNAIGGYGAAAAAEQAPIQTLLSMIATLTGAETTGESSQIYDLLNTTNQQTDFSGTEVTKGKSTPGLVPTVVSLFG